MEWMIEVLKSDENQISAAGTPMETIYQVKHAILRFFRSTIANQEKEISNMEIVKGIPILESISYFMRHVLTQMQSDDKRT
jgi:hypothetical protein